MKRNQITSVGTLSGVRVAFSAVAVAGPFFGCLCADQGADVIWLEPAAAPSLNRFQGYLGNEQEIRNMRTMALDIPSPEGKEAFLRLMKETDIFLEASKGGQYDKWGLSDEALWEVNPKLIIIHVTGYGLTGLPEYTSRPSYDAIAQAFSGLVYINGYKTANTMIADYFTALMAYGNGLAAYIKMLQTGVGDSIDCNQIESVARCMGANMVYDMNLPEGNPFRSSPGVGNNHTAGYNYYRCKDGEGVMLFIVGPAIMKKTFPVFGLEYGSEQCPPNYIYKDFTPEGKLFDEAIQKYCDEHTAEEVEAAVIAAGGPAMRVQNFEQMRDNPHFQARETFTKLYSRGMKQDVIVSNIFPKMKRNTGKLWRSATAWGEDTNDILSDLGYTDEEIAALNANNVVHQGEILD